MQRVVTLLEQGRRENHYDVDSRVSSPHTSPVRTRRPSTKPSDLKWPLPCDDSPETAKTSPRRSIAHRTSLRLSILHHQKHDQVLDDCNPADSPTSGTSGSSRTNSTDGGISSRDLPSIESLSPRRSSVSSRAHRACLSLLNRKQDQEADDCNSGDSLAPSRATSRSNSMDGGVTAPQELPSIENLSLGIGNGPQQNLESLISQRRRRRRNRLSFTSASSSGEDADPPKAYQDEPSNQCSHSALDYSISDFGQPFAKFDGSDSMVDVSASQATSKVITEHSASVSLSSDVNFVFTGINEEGESSAVGLGTEETRPELQVVPHSPRKPCGARRKVRRRSDAKCAT